jgi:hypothetical protein
VRICLVGVLCVLFSAGGSAGQNALQLRDVKKIYVDSLGDDLGASAIRTGIVHQLKTSGPFEVVESADQADAVLSGEGHVTKTKELPLFPTEHSKKTRTNFHAVATVQLKDKDGQLLWSQADHQDSISGKAGSTLGHEIAMKLVKAATPREDKKK